MTVQGELEQKRRYDRGGEEFSRVLAFSDGMFAIAMTLLVVGITVPVLKEGDSVGDLTGSFVSFVISFLVIGRYWVAHHDFFARLKAVDAGLIWINTIYLMFVAFAPFPTALLGNYFENPLAIAIYAVAVAAVSGMEVVLFRHAHHHGLMTRKLPDDVYRWGVYMSMTPVVIFIGSIPLAFIHTWIAAASWYLVVPFFALIQRWKPANVDEYF